MVTATVLACLEYKTINIFCKEKRLRVPWGMLGQNFYSLLLSTKFILNRRDNCVMIHST